MSAPIQERASLPEEKLNTVSASAPGYAAVALAAQKILQEKDLTRAISIICDEVCQLFQPDALLIQRIDVVTGARTVLANRNLPAEYLKIVVSDVSSGVIRGALLEDKLGRLEVIQEPADNERTINPDEIGKLGVRTLAVLPFHLYGDCYGGFSIYHFSPHEYSAEEMECLEALAAMSSVALQKVYLLEESENSRAILAASQRIAKIGSYQWDASLRQSQWSDEIFRIFGKDPGEAAPVFEEFLEAIHPGDKEKFLEVFRAAEKDCRPFEIELRILRPDGTERVVFDQSDPILGEGGEITGWRGAVHDITERKMVEREAESRLKRLEIVGNIARAAGAAQKPEELFATIIREIRKVIPCERCVISNWELGREGINRWHIESDIEVRPFTEEENRDAGHWVGKNVYQPGRAVNIPDLSHESFLWTNRLKEAGIRSVLHFPVMLDGGYIAHLTFYSTCLAAFTSEHEKLLTDIAVHLGPAIKNAMFYREAEARAARFQLSGEIARAVGSEIEPDELFKTIVREIRKAVPCERCGIIGMDTRTGESTLWHIELKKGEGSHLLYKDEDFIRWAEEEIYASKQSWNIDLTRSALKWTSGRLEAGVRNMMFVPILQGGECIAHIALSSNRANAFDAGHEELLASVAGHIGPAVKNAMLYREAEARSARMAVLNELSLKISGNLNPGEVLRDIVRAAAELTGGGGAHILLYEEATGSFEAVATWGDISSEKIGALKLGEGIPSIAVKTELPQILGDMQNDPRVPNAEWVRDHNFNSCIVFPIQLDRRAIVITSFSEKKNFFGESAVEIMQELAPHVAIALENATLHGQIRERAERLELVGRIVRAVGSELEPGELFKVIIDQIRKAIVCNRCVISSFRPQTFEQRVWRMESDIEVESNPNSDLRKYRYYQRVYVEHLPFNEPDIREFSTPRAQVMAAAGFRSNLIVPILQDGECVAHVGLLRTEVKAFTPEDEALLSSIASHLGAAIRNATLYRESEARAARLATTAEIARVVGSELEPEDLFRTIAEEIQKAVPCDRYMISTLDYENDVYQILYDDNPQEVLKNLKTEVSERRWVAEAYVTKRPVFIRDYREVDTHNAKVMAEAGYRSALIIPILQEDECIAHMALLRRETDAFTTDEEKLLSSISGHLGMAIRNASLFRDSEERAQRMAAFNDLSRKISENLNFEEVLESVGHAAESLLEADSVGIILIDNNSGGLIPHVLLGEVAKVRAVMDNFRAGEGAAGYVVRSGGSVVIPDVMEWPEFQMKEWARENDLRSYIAVPLKNGTKVIGMIFCLARGQGAFSGVDEEILRSLSDQAVIAIENARLHEEAQRSRVFFESVVDDNADAIHVADIEGKVIYWNPGSEKLFGYSNEEALGQHFSNLLIPEAQRERWLRSVTDRVTERGVAFHTETQRTRKDGSLVSVSLTLSPVKDADGNLIAISAMHKDLTDRKDAEEALLERENRLRTILDTAVDGIITIDERGIVNSINPSAQKLMGYTSAEVVGQNIAMLMPEPFHGEHDMYLSNYLKTGITRIMGSTREVPVLRKDGITIPVDLSVNEIWLGKRRLFNGIIRDLSERKRTEKEREEYVERLMTLNRLTQKVGTSLDLDEALEAILESTVQLLNVPYVGVFTRQGEVFALRAFRGKFHTESTNRFYRVGEGGVGLTVEKGSSLFIENVPEAPNWKMQKASWEYGIRTFLGVPLKSEGEVIGVLSCLTKEPRIYTKGEYELINAFANMAAITIRNAANHSQLKETLEELRRSQEMIIRAEKLSSLGVLSAGAAHEILNPASVILMRAEMIGEDAEEDSFENKSAEIIVRNVRRIRSICDDLRRFSRDEVPSMEPFDPDEALRFSLELIKHELSPVGIELDLKVNEIPFIAMGDSSQIQQVFVNLISNARDAMPDGGTLSIRSGRCDYAGKGFWELQISDTGVGIPEDVLPQIFDPFFTTKPADEGTGLGLSVLHGIVKSHEGEVSVESEPGKGSTFTVRLPEAFEEIGA